MYSVSFDQPFEECGKYGIVGCVENEVCLLKVPEKGEAYASTFSKLHSPCRAITFSPPSFLFVLDQTHINVYDMEKRIGLKRWPFEVFGDIRCMHCLHGPNGIFPLFRGLGKLLGGSLIFPKGKHGIEPETTPKLHCPEGKPWIACQRVYGTKGEVVFIKQESKVKSFTFDGNGFLEGDTWNPFDRSVESLGIFNDGRLAFASLDLIRLWCPKRESYYASIACSYPRSIRVLPDQTLVAISHSSVIQWDPPRIPTSKDIKRVNLLDIHAGYIYQLIPFEPHRVYIYMGYGEGLICNLPYSEDLKTNHEAFGKVLEELSYLPPIGYFLGGWRFHQLKTEFYGRLGKPFA